MMHRERGSIKIKGWVAIWSAIGEHYSF